MINFLSIKNEDEIQTLANLAGEIWNEYWPPIIKEAQTRYMIEKFQSYNAIKNQIENENYIYKIIEVNGENVGYFGVSAKNKKIWQKDMPEIGFEYLFLSKLYLKKDYRAKGLGRKAFEAVKETAREKSLNYIYLTVNKFNSNSIKAYENWGFKTVETAKTDIGQGFIMDDYIMRYEIR